MTPQHTPRRNRSRPTRPRRMDGYLVDHPTARTLQEWVDVALEYKREGYDVWFAFEPGSETLRLYRAPYPLPSFVLAGGA